MSAAFSFNLAFDLYRALLLRFELALQARSELMELRARTRETIVQSHELMALIDRQFALPQ